MEIYYEPKNIRKPRGYTRVNLVKMSKDQGSGTDLNGTWTYLLPPEYWLVRFKHNNESFIGRKRAFLLESMTPDTIELEIIRHLNIRTGTIDLEVVEIPRDEVKVYKEFTPPYPKGIQLWLKSWLTSDKERLKTYNLLIAKGKKDGVIK